MGVEDFEDGDDDEAEEERELGIVDMWIVKESVECEV